jgi:hypothetical protein
MFWLRVVNEICGRGTQDSTTNSLASGYQVGDSLSTSNANPGRLGRRHVRDVAGQFEPAESLLSAGGLQSVTDANFTTAAQIAYDFTYPI